MPYDQRRRGKLRGIRRKTAATKNKKFIENSRSAKSQQKQLTSLQRQLNATKNKLRDRAQYAQYFCPIEGGTGVQSAQIELTDNLFYVNNLMRPSSWQSIFQSTGNAETNQSNKAIIKNFDIQLVFSPKNSLTPLTPRIIRVYLVSLRKETAQEVLNATNNMSTAGLNATANGVYYQNTFVNGGLATMVKFNPAAFKLHAYREFTLANIVEETSVTEPEDLNIAITNTKDALRRFRFRLQCGNKLKPPQNTWKAMTENDIMPEDRKYLITHVGGWDNDGDNGIHMDTNICVSTRVTN